MHILLALHEHPGGVTVGPGSHVVYDLTADSAGFGAAAATGPAVCWKVAVPADNVTHEMRHDSDDVDPAQPELVTVADGSPGRDGESGGEPGGRRGGVSRAGVDCSDGGGGGGEPGGRRGGMASSVAMEVSVELDGAQEWLMRCDRVDFPPGAIAYRHTHPGPGIRRLLFGELTVTTEGVTTVHRAGDTWFESGPEPVYAESSAAEPTAFVRVMLVPAEWAGRRTIRYTDPADADRPARQRARVFLEEPLR